MFFFITSCNEPSKKRAQSPPGETPQSPQNEPPEPPGPSGSSIPIESSDNQASPEDSDNQAPPEDSDNATPPEDSDNQAPPEDSDNPNVSDEEKKENLKKDIASDKKWLGISYFDKSKINLAAIDKNLLLPTKGPKGSEISWEVTDSSSFTANYFPLYRGDQIKISGNEGSIKIGKKPVSLRLLATLRKGGYFSGENKTK